MTDLHIDRFGSGEPAIFIHGSFGWGLDTWPDQRELSEHNELLLVDRRGFGRSPAAKALGWPTDMVDMARLLEEVGPAHVIGQSYGAVVALLTAGLRPNLVRSVVAIEPVVYGLASDSHAALEVGSAMKIVYDAAPSMDAPTFAHRWAHAWGRPPEQHEAWLASLTHDHWAAVEASRREAWPGDAPIDAAALNRAGFPKVIVTGAWPASMAPGRERTRDALSAVADVLADRLAGRRVIMPRSCHNPQMEQPEDFNALLRDVWAQKAVADDYRPAL